MERVRETSGGFVCVGKVALGVNIRLFRLRLR